MKHSIAILIPYFGKWPEWIHLFIATAEKNSTIDFIFYTDCDIHISQAPNIRFVQISFDDYIKKVNQVIPYRFNPPNAYKLCDLRPLFGLIHQEDFKGYDFYGWVDTDLFLGDIRSFYTSDILQSYDVLSTHAHCISGHLALFRNTKKNIYRFLRIYRWKEALLEPKFVGIDEHGITHAYLHTIFDKLNEKFHLNINFFPSHGATVWSHLH